MTEFEKMEIEAEASTLSALATRASLIVQRVMTGEKSPEVLKTALDDLVLIDRISRRLAERT